MPLNPTTMINSEYVIGPFDGNTLDYNQIAIIAAKMYSVINESLSLAAHTNFSYVSAVTGAGLSVPNDLLNEEESSTLEKLRGPQFAANFDKVNWQKSPVEAPNTAKTAAQLKALRTLLKDPSAPAECLQFFRSQLSNLMPGLIGQVKLDNAGKVAGSVKLSYLQKAELDTLKYLRSKLAYRIQKLSEVRGVTTRIFQKAAMISSVWQAEFDAAIKGGTLDPASIPYNQSRRVTGEPLVTMSGIRYGPDILRRFPDDAGQVPTGAPPPGPSGPPPPPPPASALGPIAIAYPDIIPNHEAREIRNDLLSNFRVNGTFLELAAGLNALWDFHIPSCTSAVFRQFLCSIAFTRTIVAERDGYIHLVVHSSSGWVHECLVQYFNLFARSVRMQPADIPLEWEGKQLIAILHGYMLHTEQMLRWAPVVSKNDFRNWTNNPENDIAFGTTNFASARLLWSQWDIEHRSFSDLFYAGNVDRSNWVDFKDSGRLQTLLARPGAQWANIPDAV